MSQAARKVQPQAGQSFSGDAAEIFRLAPQERVRRVTEPLRLAVSNSKSPAKALARLADVNAATAKNWLQGRCAPSAINLLVMMARMPELRAEVRRLTEMQADLDPDFERELSGLIAAAQRLRGR